MDGSRLLLGSERLLGPQIHATADPVIGIQQRRGVEERGRRKAAGQADGGNIGRRGKVPRGWRHRLMMGHTPDIKGCPCTRGYKMNIWRVRGHSRYDT